MESLVDTRPDVKVIAPESWPPSWPLQEVNVQLLRTGTLSQEKQRVKWVKCIGPIGRRGNLKPYVTNKAINLWGHDLLQQQNTQINILTISETDHKLGYLSEKNIRRYYKEQSPIIQAVQKQGTTAVDLSHLPKVLPLKWLPDKPAWVEQWLLT